MSLFVLNGRTPPLVTTSRSCVSSTLTWQPPSPPNRSRPSHPDPSSASLLAPLLSRHPLWPRFQDRLTRGAAFPLAPIADADRRTDLAASLSPGNHKSTRGHEQKLLEMLKEKVAKGWQLLLPKEATMELPGCEVAPLGVVSQWTAARAGPGSRS